MTNDRIFPRKPREIIKVIVGGLLLFACIYALVLMIMLIGGAG